MSFQSSDWTSSAICYQKITILSFKVYLIKNIMKIQKKNVKSSKFVKSSKKLDNIWNLTLLPYSLFFILSWNEILFHTHLMNVPYSFFSCFCIQPKSVDRQSKNNRQTKLSLISIFICSESVSQIPLGT